MVRFKWNFVNIWDYKRMNNAPSHRREVVRSGELEGEGKTKLEAYLERTFSAN
jgi:hypothetical protein